MLWRNESENSERAWDYNARTLQTDMGAWRTKSM
jgi:hypothetical protein